MYFPLSTFMCVFTFLHPCLLASFLHSLLLLLLLLLLLSTTLRLALPFLATPLLACGFSLFINALSSQRTHTFAYLALIFSFFAHSLCALITHTHTDKRHASAHNLSRTRISIFITTTELFYCFLVVFFCLPFAFLDLFSHAPGSRI